MPFRRSNRRFPANFATLAIQQADVVARQVGRVLAHQRHDVLLDDRARCNPVGIEDHFVDLRVQDRCRARDTADDGGVAQHDALVFHRFDIGRRDVDHHVTDAEIAGHGLHADEVGVQLLQANIGRDVHRLHGELTHDAVFRQTVARLEALDRTVHIAVEAVRYTGALAAGRPR